MFSVIAATLVTSSVAVSDGRNVAASRSGRENLNKPLRNKIKLITLKHKPKIRVETDSNLISNHKICIGKVKS